MSLPEVPFRVLRGQPGNQAYYTYRVPLTEGMVVLDAMHYIQAHYAGDLAVRWNCKAGKCGSCSAEVNGRPALLCGTRVDALLEYGEIDVSPMKAFPLIKDLVTDVSQIYETAKQIPAFTPDESEAGPWTIYPEDVERLHEFHKCIECFLCQDVCHIIREHKAPFAGPRFLVKLALVTDASKGHSRPHQVDARGGSYRSLQHHEVLHRSLSRRDPYHRQCDHSSKGAGGRHELRPGNVAGEQG